MMQPAIPDGEQDRIEELNRLELLDTPSEERFDRYTRLARRLFDAPIALVSLVDCDRLWFKSKQGLDISQTPRDISFCGHAINGPSTLVVEDACIDPRFCDNPLVTGDPRIRFYAGCPLPGPGGSPLGTLCIIDHKPRSLCEDDLTALHDIAALVAGELSSAQMAITDPLTGVSNRRGFEFLSAQALAVSGRAGQTASIAVMDMEGFKQINDAFGHDAGDEALQTFARLLVDTLRESDVVARLGGDEFCALLTGTDPNHAVSAVERLRRAVAANNGSTTVPYTLEFSSGVARYCPGESVDQTLRKADEAMGRSKLLKRSDERAAPD